MAGFLLFAARARPQQIGELLPHASGKSATASISNPHHNHAKSSISGAGREMMTAIAMAQDGDFGDAIGAFRYILKHQPDLAEAHYGLGLALLGAGGNPQAWPSAMKQFRVALRIRPDYPEAHNMLGVGLLVNGDPEGSLKELRTAVGEAPRSAEIHLNLGKALAAVNKWKDAVTEFQEAVKLRRPYPEAEAQLGNALLNQGNKAAAASAFLSALRGNPDIESAHYGLARALRAESKVAASRVEFAEARALLQRKPDAVMSTNLSNQSLQLATHGRASQAASMAKQAVMLEPDNWIAVYNYGLLLADTGNLPGGIQEIRKAISLMPLRRSMYLSLAQMQKRIGHLDAAKCSIWRADHLPELASMNGDEQKRAMETKACLASKQRFPFGASFGDADMHCAFASYLSEKGDLYGASGELLYAAKVAPSRPDIRYSLAIVWLQMGKVEDSALELRKVLMLSPQSAKAHFALGADFIELKKYKDAETQLQQVLHLDPGNREAQRMLNEIISQNK